MAAPKKADKAPKAVLQLQDGRFVDHRWENGRWTLSKFANPATSEMDWPAWNSVRLLRERSCSLFVSQLQIALCMVLHVLLVQLRHCRCKASGRLTGTASSVAAAGDPASGLSSDDHRRGFISHAAAWGALIT